MAVVMAAATVAVAVDGTRAAVIGTRVAAVAVVGTREAGAAGTKAGVAMETRVRTGRGLILLWKPGWELGGDSCRYGNQGENSEGAHGVMETRVRTGWDSHCYGNQGEDWDGAHAAMETRVRSGRRLIPLWKPGWELGGGSCRYGNQGENWEGAHVTMETRVRTGKGLMPQWKPGWELGRAHAAVETRVRTGRGLMPLWKPGWELGRGSCRYGNQGASWECCLTSSIGIPIIMIRRYHLERQSILKWGPVCPGIILFQQCCWFYTHSKSWMGHHSACTGHRHCRGQAISRHSQEYKSSVVVVKVFLMSVVNFI